MCICAPHACRAHRDKKEASDLTELLLQTAMSCHVGDGNQTVVLLKSRQCP